jgi:lipoate-protein ligase B
VREAWLLDLGVREYHEVWALQKELVLKRGAAEIPDLLILVEHPHVITLGRRCSYQPAKLDVPVYEVERGGEATYHGPGQLVGYPIMKLEGPRRDLHRYLRDLEEVLIETLDEFAIPAGRMPGATGVWTRSAPPRKIASIGIAVRSWVTYHGFALNVSTDLSYFQLISPCGFDSSVMTSMEQELGEHVGMGAVKERLKVQFAERFGLSFSLPLGKAPAVGHLKR